MTTPDDKKRRDDIANSDQSESTLGIRDVGTHDSEDGKFNESRSTSTRRDSEESLYDEAGQPAPRRNPPANPEGSKISQTEPQESL